MKKTFLTLLLLALVGCVIAQQQGGKNQSDEKVAIGIRIGGNLANYSYPNNADMDGLGLDSLMNRVRPVLGVNVEFPLFGGVVYVAPEVSLTMRGDSRLFQSNTLNEMVRYQVWVNYLEGRLPISVAIPISRVFKPYVFAAPSFGVVLPTLGPFNSEIRQKSLDANTTINDKVPVGTDNMAPYDYGVTAGAGFRFTFDFPSLSMIVKLEGGYYMGFADTYSEKEHNDQAQAVNVNAYNISGSRLNRGIEAALTIAIPLDFHPRDDCFYWADMEKKKDKNRGMYGF